MLVLLTQREVQQAVQLLLQCGDEVRYVGDTNVEPVDDTVAGTSDNTDILKLVKDISIQFQFFVDKSILYAKIMCLGSVVENSTYR